VQLAFAAEMALAAVAVVLGAVVGVAPLKELHWSWSDVGAGLLATVPLVVLLFFAIWQPFGPIAKLSNIVAELVQVLFDRATIVDVAAVSAAAGFGEEMLFRGLIQTGALRATGSPWLAVATGAILFGAVHPITRTYAIMAGGIGAYLGWLQITTGNLLVPIVAHATYDFCAILYFLRVGRAEESILSDP
jgi:membrane protease YdiL (CAAX protease family)